MWGELSGASFSAFLALLIVSLVGQPAHGTATSPYTLCGNSDLFLDFEKASRKCIAEHLCSSAQCFQTGQVPQYDARQHGRSRETCPSDISSSHLEEKHCKIQGAAVGSPGFT